MPKQKSKFKARQRQKKNVTFFFVQYGLHILVILFLTNVALLYSLQFFIRANTACMTKTQVAQDKRCLYVVSGKVYSKGTRSSPHHGHPCGTDVTSVIPSFHINSPAMYMTPNYVANICIAPTPTRVPTLVPTKVPTPIPTSVPTQAPTTTLIPTIVTPAATTTSIPLSQGVPSPACLGACPTAIGVMPTTEPVQPVQSTTPVNNVSTSEEIGLIGLILQMVSLLLKLLLSIIG